MLFGNTDFVLCSVRIPKAEVGLHRERVSNNMGSVFGLTSDGRFFSSLTQCVMFESPFVVLSDFHDR